MCSTLHELLDESAALSFMDAGVPAVAGLRTGLAAAAAFDRPGASPARLRETASTARAARVPPASATASSANGRRWLSEHEAKELLREAGLPVVDGRLVGDEDEAVVALSEFGGRVALKLTAPSLQHKADLGAVIVDLATEDGVRAAHRGLIELGVADGRVLVERMAPAGAELLVAARADAVVPCVVVAVGGIWTEVLDDAAIVPLPASPEQVEQAILGLRAAPALTGAHGAAKVDVAAAAHLAAAAGELLVAEGLALIELNPVFVHERGAVAVDAVAALPAPAP